MTLIELIPLAAVGLCYRLVLGVSFHIRRGHHFLSSGVATWQYLYIIDSFS